MTRILGTSRLVVLWFVAAICPGVGGAQVLSSPDLLPTRTQPPQAFGTQDYTITAVSAASFTGGSFNVSPSLGRSGVLNVDQHFYATLEIPAGVIIDYIGLNNLNDGNSLVIGTQVLKRNELVGGVSDSPHTSWQTDRNAELAELDGRGRQRSIIHKYACCSAVTCAVCLFTAPLPWLAVWSGIRRGPRPSAPLVGSHPRKFDRMRVTSWRRLS